MYRIRLSAPDRRLYTRALRGGDVDLRDDPDVEAGRPPEESDEDPKADETPTAPQPDPGGNPMRIVTANIKTFMSPARKAEDYKKVGELGSILMFQEIGEGVDQDLLRQHLPASDWHILPTYIHATDKIAIKKSLWDVEQAGYYYMSPRPPVMGRKRYVTLALVTSKTVSGLQFLVCNTHYVAYAWSAKKIADKEFRKRAWNMHHDRFEALVLDARSKGITVIGGGDFNRTTFDKFHANQTWIYPPTGIDHIFGIEAPGGASYTVQSTQSVALNSDHNARVAQLSWTAGANPVQHGYHWTGA